MNSKLAAACGAVSAATVCISIAVGVVTGRGHAQRPLPAAGSVIGTSSSPSSMQSASTAPSQISASLPPDVSAAMNKAGIDVAETSQPEGGISKSQAFNNSVAGLSFLSAATPVSATLCTFTDTQVGHPTATSADGQPEVAPRYAGETVWVLVFDDVHVPDLGGPFIPGSAEPSTDTSPTVDPSDRSGGRMWIAVDAQSGNVVEARTLS